MYGYIYETTNLINGKKYIGKHISNIFEPDKYIGSGTLILKAIKKYGKENFKCRLIEECSSLEELNDREKYWVSYCNSVLDENYYNLAKGGDGGSGRGAGSYWIDKNKRAAALEKQKESLNNFYKENPYVHSGKNNPMYGKHHTEKAKKVISINSKTSEGVKNSTRFKGHAHSTESRKKISDALSGRVWITDGINSKMILKEDILPEGWWYGRKLSGETLNRRAKEYEYSKIEKTPGKKKRVKCVELNIVFNSIKEASDFCGNRHVADCCYGRRNIAAGYHWEFVL